MDGPPPYATRVTTRGYECDATKRVPIPQLFRYLEHLRWLTIADEQSGLAPLVHAGHFFVVHTQTICVERRLGQGVPLEVLSWSERVGRSQITVGHAIRRADDLAVVATARVVGLWMGPNRRLARIPDALRAFATAHGPPARLDRPSARPGDEASYLAPPEQVHAPRGLDLALPEDHAPEGALRYPVQIRPSDEDIFGHVNAAKYVELFDDARLAAGWAGTPLRVTIKYHRETLVGELAEIQSWRVPDAPGRIAHLMRVGGELRCSATTELEPG